VRRKVVAVAVAVGAVSVLPFLAGAEPEVFKDPDDTRGRLDIKRVEMGGSNDRVRYKIVTYPRWKTSAVRDQAYIVILFDTFGNKRFDYYALIGSNGSKLYGGLWRDRKNKSDRKVANLSAWRPGKRSVGVRIPIGRMRWPETRAFYRWRAQTLFTGKNCRSVCFDVVPNSGRVTVYRPGASPTPTPTETPPDAS
jgi:hypothetical protein